MNTELKQLLSLAISFAAEFRQGCRRSHIDEAIVLDREALEICPSGHPTRANSLTQLSIHLSDRYNQFGETGDLEEAITLARDALSICPTGHVERGKCLNILANRLSNRFEQLGTIVDLNEAIILSREALSLCPPGHVLECSKYSNNVANNLSKRYQKLRAIIDLSEAISLARDALAFCPPEHPARSKRLNNLANHLSDRYRHLGMVVDLDEATALVRKALALCPYGNPSRSKCLNNLGKCLSIRYKEFGVLVDLNEAIDLARDALELRPPGHPARSKCLNNLTSHLSDRFKRLGATVDIDEAIALDRDALEICPLGHPLRSCSLENLGSHLLSRFMQSKDLNDKEESFSIYTQISDISPIMFSNDLSAAIAWISAAENFQHPTTLLAYETSLQLLIRHFATLPSLPQHLDILKTPKSSLAMDGFSACLRNRSPTKAIELLEQGRGIFWSLLARLRSPLDEVVASGPAGKMLSDKFKQLASLIRNALKSPGEDQHDRVYPLSVELEGVVANIRELPGLSHFLLPSPFSDLRKAASGGPVIIVNASKYGCDALIVMLDRDPVHIPLQITIDRVRDMSSELHVLTKRAKLESLGKYFGAIMRELWKFVVSPIVDVLQTIHPPQSRIWWCPTAEFSLLPFHAAGSYRSGERTLSDLYISSYTPTLTTLIRAREHKPSNSAFELPRFVAIGQAKAAGESELVSVGAELANIGQRVKRSVTFKSIEGSDSCIPQVTEELNKNEWVHLACHGLPNRKRPFESAFALHDGRFTIEHIIRCESPNAQFAYLSACHTTVGDEECPDEMIHLASAIQFAGFRSVIGTMWAVDDRQTEQITSVFYDNMVDESGRLDHTRAAFALHKTMQTVNVPFDQRILYIHIGA